MTKANITIVKRMASEQDAIIFKTKNKGKLCTRKEF